MIELNVTIVFKVKNMMLNILGKFDNLLLKQLVIHGKRNNS